jgi:hypothetical protein
LTEELFSFFVKIADGNSGSQDGIIRMASGHVSGGFRGQIVELNRGDAVKNSIDHFLSSGVCKQDIPRQ